MWLTVTGVKVHPAGNEEVADAEGGETESPDSNDGWRTLKLASDPEPLPPFDLLALQGDLKALLAKAEDLPAGKYTQIRLEISLVQVVLEGDLLTRIDAKLPSNTLKFVHPFEIVDGETTELTFDFDALKSIHQTGKGDYMCKPVITITTDKEPGDGAEVAEASTSEAASLEITTESLPDGTVLAPYGPVTLTVEGGEGPYTWTIVGQPIPDLTLTEAGVLSGTPAAVGDYTLTVRVEGSNQQGKKIATKTFTVTIAEAATQ